MKVNEEMSAMYKTKAKTRRDVKTPASKKQGPTYSKEEPMCNIYGRKHQARQCPAYGKECYNYKKGNHFTNATESKQAKHQSEFLW